MVRYEYVVRVRDEKKKRAAHGLSYIVINTRLQVCIMLPEPYPIQNIWQSKTQTCSCILKRQNDCKDKTPKRCEIACTSEDI